MVVMRASKIPDEIWRGHLRVRSLYCTIWWVLILSGIAQAQTPDLSGLDRDTRQSIELACITEKTQGPAPYRGCLEQQLQSIGISVD